jgi:hypothetical protein
MGNHLKKYKAKQREQRVNSQENRLYYQNGSDQSTPRSPAKQMQDRRLQNDG